MDEQPKIVISNNLNTSVAFRCGMLGVFVGGITYLLIRSVALRTIANVNTLLNDVEPLIFKETQ